MIEIERKYLVEGKPWEQYEKVKSTDIKQGYISKSKKHTVRIRLTNKKAMITIKGPTKGFSRSEFEYEIPYDDGLELIKMCDGDLIDKTRYVVTDEHGQVWDIDEFHGINEGLVVAEIEIPSEDTPIVIPNWVTKEVTFGKRYMNVYLSSHLVSTTE